MEQIFLRKDPIAILYIRSHLKLVVDLQTNVKAMQSAAYAHKVKISNLQQMTNTIIYVQEHGYDTQSDLKNTVFKTRSELTKSQNQLTRYSSELKVLNSQIHYTGQYFSNKSIYSQFLQSKNKGKFRKEHLSEIQAYEDARDWLKSFYLDGKMHSIKTLKSQKMSLLNQIETQKISIQSLQDNLKELETAYKNVESILQMQVPKKKKSHEQEL